METTPTPPRSVLSRLTLLTILLSSFGFSHLIGQSSTCVPGMVNNANGDPWSEECYLDDNCQEQGNPCTANDVTLLGVFIADAMGNPVPACSIGSTETVLLWGTFNNNTGTNRYAVRARTEVWINGNFNIELNACSFNILPAGTSDVALLGSFTYTCGDQIQLLNTWVAWNTSSSQCSNPLGANYAFDCNDYSPSKCSKNLGFIDFLTPNFSYTCGVTTPTTTEVCFTNLTIGGTPPLTYAWNFGDGGTSTAENPCHTYNAITGTFMVTLTVTDSNGVQTGAFLPLNLDSLNCCQLTVTCPPANGGVYSCVSQIPLPNPDLITITDSCGPVTITVQTVSTGSGCGTDTLVVTRKYIISDGTSMDTCTQVFKVRDNTPPSITCPAGITVTCSGNVPAPNTGLVTASDNCTGSPVITFVSDVTVNQTCVNRYTLNRTYRATDACGNSSTCAQTITVFDNTAPTLTCPTNLTVTCANNVPTPNPGSISASDNCGGAPVVTFVNDVTVNQTCVNRYTLNRTYRATDACGNSSTCLQTISVFDNVAPSITCPPNVTVSCIGQVPAINVSAVMTSDNCGGTVTVTHVSDQISGTMCSNKLTLTRTYRAIDACGNSATCAQVILVNDQTPPSITCPAAITVTCASQVPTPSPGSVVASDNCGGSPTVVFVSDVTVNQTCTNKYMVTRTYRATDACGNSSTCTQAITVNDQTPPTISCPANITVTCASLVPVPNTTSVGAGDNCTGGVTITHVQDIISNQTCTNRYLVTRTYRATDACGNSATCNQLITVNDQTPPAITCPANITVQCAAQVPIPNTANVTSSDNCNGVPTVTFVNDVTVNQTCVNRYMVQRTYRATDECGNSSTCQQTITVFDNTLPAITCPPDLTVQCASQVPGPNTGSVTASDNCNGTPVVTFVSDVTVNQSCANRYTLNRTYRATDECGNSATCLQIITVFDNTLPGITCPTNVTVQCASQVPAPSPASVAATDNCGGSPAVTFVSDVTVGQTCLNRYSLQRTYRATDACGNSATCVQVITVFDSTSPSITCPANVTVQCASQVPTPAPGSVMASDNCNGSPVITFVNDVTVNQTCVNRYTLNRTYRAMDECGNSSTCVQVITVFDNTPPSIQCPPNTTVQCAAQVPSPDIALVSAPDNCGGATTVTFVNDVISNQVCANRYLVTRTYRATDVCGNSATCAQLITVFDDTAPSITCPNNITVQCASNVPPPNTGLVTASDNCIGTPSITHVGDVVTNQTCANRYILVRTYRAMDACGNSATCQQLIMVRDNTPPSITCPTNITVSCTGAIPAPDPGAIPTTENCGGMVTVSHLGDVISNQTCANRYIVARTYRATDLCGNSATCVQLITVYDQTPPSITCPVNLTVSCSGNVPAPNTESVASTDNCGTVTVQHIGDLVSNQTCANRYTLTRTYRATDACGNSATCQQVITVNDQTPPAITCPDDITIESGASTSPDNTGNADASDNCGGNPEITYDDITVEGICVEEYNILRTWTASDACGNSATCLQEILVSGGCVLDLGLEKDLEINQPMTFTPGDNVVFTIRVINHGNVPVGSIVVVDYIPAGFMLNDPDWTPGTEGSTGQSATIILSIGNGALPPGGLPGGADVSVNITLTSDPNLPGGFYENEAEVSSVYGLDGTDLSDLDVDSHPDTDNTNDAPGEDDLDPAVLCVNTQPHILGRAIVCSGDIAIYEIEHYNPAFHYDWQVGDGGVIIESTDSTITVLWYGPQGSTSTVMVTEIVGEGCQFSTQLTILIGDGGPLACLDHVNLSIDNDCGTRIVASMILTGVHQDNDSYIIYVIDMATGDTIPDATVTWEHVGMTFKVSVRNRCTGQSCWGFVTIEDKLPPIIACRCAVGEPNERCRISCLQAEQILNGDVPEHLRPVVVDNCGGTTLEITNIELDYEACDIGHVTISWLATDASGNTATCVQEIAIYPLTISELSWPPDRDWDCGADPDPVFAGWPKLDGLNLSPFVQSCNIMTWYDDQVIPLCGGGKKILRRWKVTNWCNAESANHMQQIFLRDKTAPVLSCSPDITVSTDVWSCYGRVTLSKPNAIDACSDIINYQLFASAGTVTVNGNQYVITNLPVGTHQLTWKVTDECYNQSSCTTQVTVKDNTPPVVSCQAHTVVSLTNDRPDGITLVPATSFDDQSFDNCSAVSFRARRMDSCIDINWTTLGACVDDVPGGFPPVNEYDLGTAFAPCVPVACCDIGRTLMIQLEVSDASGNVNYCMVEVVVQDKLRPELICLPDIIVSCEFPFDAEPGTYSDATGNNNGNLDEDPLSEMFGNVYDAARYPSSVREPIIINDPNSTINPQPHHWGLDGWADDNCQVILSVEVREYDDCTGQTLPGNVPQGAVKLIQRRIEAFDGVQYEYCTQRIWVVDYDRFTITDTDCTNANPNDDVIWPCDVLINTCPDEITNTGEPVIFDDGCSLVGVTYEDEEFDFAEGACYKILRTWKVLDWCQFNPNTGYGLWTYVQTIKVADATGPEFLDCPAEPVELCTDDPGVSLPDNNQIFLGYNDPDATSCSAHVILQAHIQETCSPSVIYDVKFYPFNDPVFFQVLKPETILELDANHEGDLYFDTRESPDALIASRGLPYSGSSSCGATHRILWTVEDGCGNRTYCEYFIRLVDCKNPVPVCIDGLSSVVMPPDGEVTLFADDFNASSIDDCTPPGGLLYSFSGAAYQPSFTFTCDNVPVFGVPFDVEVWVADNGVDLNCNSSIEWDERNKDFCVASLMITDNNDVCQGQGAILTGDIMTEQTEAISNVMVHLEGPQAQFPGYLTANEGQYSFSHLPVGQDYTIRPERTDDPRNGVSTLDLVQIQKHLLGKEPFLSPYQYIAADANNSSTVSAIDLIEIRKLILGLYEAYPANTSWRFVKEEPSGLSLPPWPLTESIAIYALQPDTNARYDFVGIKIGDVNHSAQAHATQVMPRNARPVVPVKMVPHGAMKPGEWMECKFILPDWIEGFQWTFETKGLEFAEITSTVIPIDESNVGLLRDGMMTISWNGEPFLRERTGEISWVMKFRVKEEEPLAAAFRLTSAVTSAEAYSGMQDIYTPKLEIDETRAFTDFALYQNKPNPWNGQTLVEFDLPVASAAILTVYDLTGKIVKVVEGYYRAGHNSIMLTSFDIPSPGVLYYRLDSGQYSATKKMMILE